MFDRQHHRRIEGFLKSLDPKLFARANCYFGGGTAIILSLGDYREAADVNFMCSSTDGYRFLRDTLLEKIMDVPLELNHEFRADRNGTRAFIKIDGCIVKFEIVKEGRVELVGDMDPVSGVPTLSRDDMYAEKLLANADRGFDPFSLSRDVIDLAMMIAHWGPIPEQSWLKARGAYGFSIDTSYSRAIDMVSNPRHLKRCLKELKMDPHHFDAIPELLRSCVQTVESGEAPPGRTRPSF